MLAVDLYWVAFVPKRSLTHAGMSIEDIGWLRLHYLEEEETEGENQFIVVAPVDVRESTFVHKQKYF